MPEKKNSPITEWPKDERPREKALRHGIGSLTKSELLAILVGSGSHDESAVELMKRVLASCGNSIKELSRLSVDDLQLFKGIGEVKALTIKAACELWKRRSDGEEDEPIHIRASRDLYNYFYPILSDSPIERCYVLLLNNNHRVIDHSLIGSGGFTATAVDIRMVVREALLKRAVAIALCHNHPSGSVKPSRQDDSLTDSLVGACKLMDIRLIDHIILADGAFYSYNDECRL